MRIRNRIASFLFKAAIALMGVLALAQQLGLFEGTFKLQFFCYFTNLSNVLVTAYFIGAAVHVPLHRASPPRVWKPKFKYASMMAVTVTCLIAHFMLHGAGSFVDGQPNLPVLALHYFIPICAVLDWLLFDEKGRMSLSGPFAWVVFPLVYLAYVMIMVNVLGVSMNGLGVDMNGFGQSVSDPTWLDSRYPYPFVDVDARGVQQVAVTCGVLVAAFIGLGYVYVIVDRVLAAAGRHMAKQRATESTQEDAEPLA